MSNAQNPQPENEKAEPRFTVHQGHLSWFVTEPFPGYSRKTVAEFGKVGHGPFDTHKAKEYAEAFAAMMNAKATGGVL